MSHAYIFEGEKGSGKQDISKTFAKSLLCEALTAGYKPCEQCRNCKRISSGNHPDVHLIERDGLSIKKENGRVFSNKGQAVYNSLLGIDATELSGLDDLHAPEGAILRSEELLADLYGVQKSYFLVNGSTVGNLAMILATCREGDKVLVQRNCHKSILRG